jgi:hypothetical protein
MLPMRGMRSFYTRCFADTKNANKHWFFPTMVIPNLSGCLLRYGRRTSSILVLARKIGTTSAISAVGHTKGMEFNVSVTHTISLRTLFSYYNDQMNFGQLSLTVLQSAIRVAPNMIAATHSNQQGTGIVLIMHISVNDVWWCLVMHLLRLAARLARIQTIVPLRRSTT